MIGEAFDDVADPVAQALAWRPIAEAFFSANEAKALAILRSGGTVAGWKPVESGTRRKWAPWPKKTAKGSTPPSAKMIRT